LNGFGQNQNLASQNPQNHSFSYGYAFYKLIFLQLQAKKIHLSGLIMPQDIRTEQLLPKE